MQLLYRKFIQWLEKQNLFLTCIVFVLISYIFSIIGYNLSTIFEFDSIAWLDPPTVMHDRLIFSILSSFGAIVIGPFLETAIFQNIPYEVAYNRGIFRNRDWLFIIFFASFFGIIHLFGPGYILFAFFTGISFNWAYIFAAKRGKKPFALIYATHAIRNAIAVAFQLSANISS